MSYVRKDSLFRELRELSWQVKENYRGKNVFKKQYSSLREKEEDLCTKIKAKVEVGQIAIFLIGLEIFFETGFLFSGIYYDNDFNQHLYS